MPENTNGAPGVNTYFDLMNTWVNGLAAALQGRSLLMDLSLFLPPLVACLVIVAIHSYLGLHVIAREVIFVDLSLAQMAALFASRSAGRRRTLSVPGREASSLPVHLAPHRGIHVHPWRVYLP